MVFWAVSNAMQTLPFRVLTSVLPSVRQMVDVELGSPPEHAVLFAAELDDFIRCNRDFFVRGTTQGKKKKKPRATDNASKSAQAWKKHLKMLQIH